MSNNTHHDHLRSQNHGNQSEMERRGYESSTSSSRASFERLPREFESRCAPSERASADPRETGSVSMGNQWEPEKSNHGIGDDGQDKRSRACDEGQGLNREGDKSDRDGISNTNLSALRDLERERSRGVEGGSNTYSRTKEFYDHALPSSTGVKETGIYPSLDALEEDIVSVKSWEYVGDRGATKSGTSYGNNAKGASDDVGISNDKGFGLNCGRDRSQTKHFETADNKIKSSINKHGSSGSGYRDSTNKSSDKSDAMNSETQIDRSKHDSEKKQYRGKARRGGDSESSDESSSDDSASSDNSESGTDSESSDSAASDDRKSSDDTSDSSESDDDGDSEDSDRSVEKRDCPAVKTSTGRNSGDYANKDGNNGEHKGNFVKNKEKAEEYGDSSYLPDKYSRKQNSRDVGDESHSNNSLNSAGGAVPKDKRKPKDTVSDYQETNCGQDEQFRGSEYQNLPNQANSTRRVEEELSQQMSRLSIGDVKYMWQFQNEHGSWVTYGQSNSKSAFPTSSKVTSDDIENYYLTDPEKIPLLIETEYNSYVLNFQTMTQTNEKTKVQRIIRRVPKQETMETLPQVRYGPPPVPSDVSGNRNTEYNFSAATCSERQSSRDNISPAQEAIPITHEWQFEDACGNWITFGQASSGSGHARVSTTSSDDIERFHSSPPNKVIMPIESLLHKYVLNFQTMTQINSTTQFQRKIRRVPKLRSSKKGFLMFQFHQLKDFFTGDKNCNSNGKYADTQNTDTRENPVTHPKPKAAENFSHGEHFMNGSTPDSHFGSMTQFHGCHSDANANPVHLNRVGDKGNNESRFGMQGSSNHAAINQSNVNPVNHRAERFHGNMATHTDFENSIGGAHSSVRLYTNQCAPVHGAASLGSFPGTKTAHLPSNTPPPDVSLPRHVWQFQDEHSAWITYGKTNSVGNVICTTSATSDDIERHYCVNKEKVPMIIESSYNRYVLDFQTMTQTNEITLVQRPFRRMPSHLTRD